MPTIKELNEAIETIRKECQSHDDCRFCLMEMNCNDSVPFNWDTIEEGEHDAND